MLSNYQPNVKATHRDMDNFLNFLIDNKVIDPKKTILVGRSLGGLFASKLSTNHKLAGLVLFSAFYSIREIVKAKLGSWFSKTVEEKSEPCHYIQRNLNPTLIIHGKKDKLVNYQQAEMMKENCRTLCEIDLMDDMGHEMTNYSKHFFTPIKGFIYRNRLI